MAHPLQWLFSLVFHYSKRLKPDLRDEQAAEGSFLALNTLLYFPLTVLTDVLEYVTGLDFGVAGVVLLWLAMCFGTYHWLKPLSRWADMTWRYPHAPTEKSRIYFVIGLVTLLALASVLFPVGGLLRGR